MRQHEQILIFSGGTIQHKNLTTRRMTYNPQGLIPYKGGSKFQKVTCAMYRGRKIHEPHEYNQEYTNYPRDVIYFDSPYTNSRVHPSQKPVALLEYLIKTYKNAERLVRTELNFAQNQAARESLESAGLKEYEFLATLDHRTTARCQALDGTVHLLEEYMPGSNAPPMHPRCRSTICANVEGGTRVAKVKGKSIRVPAEMSYEKWREGLKSGNIVPQGFKRQEHFSSSEENLKATNPNYLKNIWYRSNCQRCVPTYEMRMRGYEVTAKPARDNDEFAEKHWRDIFKDVIIEKINGKSGIISKMQEWGDGARAEVYIEWDYMNAHVFIAENRNGKICFLDPQTGEADVEHYFLEGNATEFFRIDNLDINEKYIRECCEERTK